MKFVTIFDIYELISSGTKNNAARKDSFKLRKNTFNTFSSDMVKTAFDTRRIDQETTYNPRRGLQNYHRSDPFISQLMLKKIEAFKRLAIVLDQIKIDYGREPEWQDSYARVLQSSIQKGLRVKQGDGDFSDAQPSMGSLDYLDELLYVRYRLTSEALMNTSEKDLRDIILNKDELLSNGGFNSYNESSITPSDVGNFSYDHMMDKMLASMAQVMTRMKQPDDLTTKLFDVKATQDNPDIERIVTISIKDKINNTIEKTSEKDVESNLETKAEDKKEK